MKLKKTTTCDGQHDREGLKKNRGTGRDRRIP